MKINLKQNEHLELQSCGSTIYNLDALSSEFIGSAYVGNYVTENAIVNSAYVTTYVDSLCLVNSADISTFTTSSDVNSLMKTNLREMYLDHEYVDLGLPSGTLWATHNIGSSAATEAGLYFQWGDIQGYDERTGTVGRPKVFSEKSYKFINANVGDVYLMKYAPSDYRFWSGIYEPKPDDKSILFYEDDAASYLWGRRWSIPTDVQFNELTVNTTKSQISGALGTYGWRFSSTAVTGAYIDFYPFGIASGDSVVSTATGAYWSKNIGGRNSLKANYFTFGNGTLPAIDYHLRYLGMQIRPVINPSDII